MEHSASLLCAGRLDKIRRRYRRATGRQRRMYEHLIWIARHPELIETQGMEALHLVPEGLVRPMARPDERCYGFLAWLLTGDASLAELSKPALWRFCDSVPLREDSEWTQMHTWCDSFPVARYGVFYDWLKAGGMLTPAEDARFRDAFLYYCRMHPYERLKARLVEGTSGNNQNGAMAYACVMAGYLFGHKYGNDPQALRLLEYGLPFLKTFVTHWPAGGYSGEGSSYMLGVNALLVVLGLELLEAATGREYFDCRVAPELATPRETLESVVTQCSRSGLAHPWDNYGYSLVSHGLVGAYLAHRTGDARRLRFQDGLGATCRATHIGWGFDNLLWTLLFRPLDRECHSREDLSLNELFPTLKATLEGPQRRYHCLQMWDRSGWPPVRVQFNPNSLVTEYDGLPLLVDGSPWEAGKERFNRPEFKMRRADLGTEMNIGIGTAAAHNVIVIDGEDWYASRPGTAGTFQHAAFLGDAGYARADVAACYAQRYDVLRMTRESLLLDDDVLLVRDRLTARTPHEFTWLGHLRPGSVTCRDGLIRLETPEHLVHDIVAAEGSGYFARREGNCEEVGYAFRGADASLVTALCVTPRLLPLQDLTDGWLFAWAGSEADAKALAATEFAGTRANLDQGPWFLNTTEDRPGFGVYRRSVTLKRSAQARCFLRVPPLSMDLLLGINGNWHEFRLAFEAQQILPNWLDVTAFLKPGRNRFVLITKSSLEMALSGRVVLAELAAAPPDSRLERTGSASYVLHCAGHSDRILWQDAPAEFRLDDLSGTAAACIRRSRGLLVALQARELRTPHFHLSAEHPVDVSLNGLVLTLANPGADNRITFAGPDGRGELELHPFPHLRWISGNPGFHLRLALPASATATVFMNGRPLAAPGRWEQGIVLGYEAPALPVALAGGTGPVSVAELARIGVLPVALKIAFAPRVLAGIGSDDWRIQLEALEAGRGLNQLELVAAALALLGREIETHESLPRRRDGDRVWYRLKAAAARFLGDAKAAEAVPLLIRELTSGDIYPARIACVEALVAIGTPEALAAVQAVPETDEWNTAARSRLLTGGNVDAH